MKVDLSGKSACLRLSVSCPENRANASLAKRALSDPPHYRPAVLLSDLHRGSFRIVGDLYEATFHALGIEVVQMAAPTTASERRSIGERFSGAVFFHNTVGRNFVPIEGETNIAMVLHEWSRYPAAWAPYLEAFDEIWVTTHHLQKVLSGSGVATPVTVLPPALDLETAPSKTNWESQSPFEFLYVGETHFRKGLHLLFAAWEQAFPESGAARLTIKTSANCPFESPRPDIQILTANWNRQELLELYPKYDCLVSASLGEGWGLPVAEAIRARLPVAANLWGGHASMLNAENCFSIHHQEIHQPYCSAPELYAPGQQCAFSEPDQVAAALRRVVDSTAEERQRISEQAVSDLWKHCSFDSIQSAIAERMAPVHA